MLPFQCSIPTQLIFWLQCSAKQLFRVKKIKNSAHWRLISLSYKVGALLGYKKKKKGITKTMLRLNYSGGSSGLNAKDLPTSVHQSWAGAPAAPRAGQTSAEQQWHCKIRSCSCTGFICVSLSILISLVSLPHAAPARRSGVPGALHRPLLPT